MASPSEKLAESLEVLKKLQTERGVSTVRSRDLSRTHRERLIANGFLLEVIKGWYIHARPDDKPGGSYSWYASFWKFCADYLDFRFGDEWCLSPEQSLLIHNGNMTVPGQLLVRSPRAKNNKVILPHNTSIFDINASIPGESEIIKKEGLNLFSLPSALVASSPGFFSKNPTDARAALSILKDPSDILSHLLDGGHSSIAGRLAGAFRNIERDEFADNIINTMKSAGYDIREDDPFNEKLTCFIKSRETSPYVNRIIMMWQQMRQTVIDRFPSSNGLPKNIDEYLNQAEEKYVTDAYHSLSIEGFQVTKELIEHVRSGKWNPELYASDNGQRNALAARGYWRAFQSVKKSMKQVLRGKNPGEIAEADLGTWYRELFAPSVTAGLIKPSDLAGYRSSQVYIKGSMHIPLNPDSLRDAIPALFDQLKQETEPSVRAVLGHFIFVYIHPYSDGNGRIGRFLMNLMLASGGYPWTIIPVENRNKYMSALEKASVNQDICDFTDFIATHVSRK